MSEIDYEAPLEPRDYATARRIVASDYSDEKRELEIMAALSSERAKTRAPFLALADRISRPLPPLRFTRFARGVAAGYARSAGLIRAAAQDQT